MKILPLILPVLMLFFVPAHANNNAVDTNDASSIIDKKKEDQRALVGRITDATLAILKDTKKKPADRTETLERAFAKVVDTDWIAKFVLGNGWRLATDAQKERFAELYRRYLTRVYVSNYAESSDRKITAINILGMSDAPNENFITKTEIKLSNSQSLKVDYLVRETEPSKYKIIDVTIEGVSLLTTHRAEFGALINKKGVDGVLTILETLLENPNPQLQLSMNQVAK